MQETFPIRDQLANRVCSDIRAQPRLQRWQDMLQEQVRHRLRPGRHGDLEQWMANIDALPDIRGVRLSIENGVISLGMDDRLSSDQERRLESSLRGLMPWRKGPFSFFGLEVDAEWRSDMKWDRLCQQLGSLDGEEILDVGCGNGYFGWRILDQGANYVLGIDPSVRFLVQFLSVQGYLEDSRFDMLPLRSEDLPADMACFDTVFSMGVIYHRRSPEDHLAELMSFVRPGGRLVLETLVIPGAHDEVLVPVSRYAQMRNVWFVPTTAHMATMMEQAGLENVRCVDITTTTEEEQRCTNWMQFQSLANFLDPADPTLTIEGHPSPRRAIFLAHTKE